MSKEMPNEAVRSALLRREVYDAFPFKPPKIDRCPGWAYGVVIKGPTPPNIKAVDRAVCQYDVAFCTRYRVSLIKARVEFCRLHLKVMEFLEG